MKENHETATGIRITVANDMVNRVLNYYVKVSGTDVDSLAYLIQNGFITSTNF